MSQGEGGRVASAGGRGDEQGEGGRVASAGVSDQDEDRLEDTQPVVPVVPPPPPPGLPPPPRRDPEGTWAAGGSGLEPTEAVRSSWTATTPPPPPPAPEVAPSPRPAEPPAAPGPRATNPTAVAALVVGVVAVLTGVFPLTVPLGILLGIAALVLGGVGITKGRRPNTSGKGLAVGGMLTGLIGLVAGCVWLAVAIGIRSAAGETGGLVDEIQSLAQRESSGRIRSVFDLSVGDCYDDLLGGAEQVPLVSCAQPHRHEVYAVLQMEAGVNVPYPGPREVQYLADARCKSEPFRDFVGSNFYGSDLVVSTIHPNEQSWVLGDREIVCAVSHPAGETTGTLRGYAQAREPQAPPLEFPT